MGIFDGIRAYFIGREEKALPARPGRNEPCWCGSGKKYKRCHLPEDEKKPSRCAPNCGPT